MNADQIALKLIEQLHGMWRFRWTGLIAACVVGLLGWLWVVTMPDQFDAEAQVYVDTESTLKPLLSGLSVPTDTLNAVSMMTRALLSRPQLEKVVNNTPLQERVESPEEYEMLLARLARSIMVTKTPGENIYRIWYQDQDPNTARDVVGALLDNLMQSSFDMDASDTAQAQSFLEDQIASYEVRLVEAEERLADFKKENVGMMPGEGGDFYVRLQNEEAGVRELETRVDAARQSQAELERQLSGEQPVFGLANPVLQGGTRTTSVSSTIGKLELDMEQLLLRYTEKHPDVVSIRETLEDLYQIRDEELAGRASSVDVAANANVEMNPVYQDMRKQKSQIDVELAGLQAQLRERKGTVAYLRRQVDTIPEVEAQLNRLARDYNVVKAQYETLLQRLESARIADDVREDSEAVTFDVVEPPRVPLLPSGPDRPALSVLIFLVAAAVAIGVAFLMNQSRPVFFSSYRLGSSLHVPVFGTVGLAAAARSRRSTWLFSLAAAGFFCAFLFVLLFGRQSLLLLTGGGAVGA